MIYRVVMDQHNKILILSLVLLTILSIPAHAETVSREQLSRQTGSYLELIDQGLYENAWTLMSPLFQALNTQPLWQSRQQAIHSAYGPLTSRELLRISYRQSYALSPDGQYIITQFKSSYLNRNETVETVILDCSTPSECTIREYIIR